MNASRDPERLIHAFLLEGEEELQDQLYDAVRAEIEQKRQRAFIGPWRTPAMNRFLSIGLGAAAVVAIGLFLGAQLFGRPGSNSGAPGVEATPTADASAAEATPTPEASTANPTDFGAVPMGTRLDEGDYVFTHMDGVRVVFTASAVWEKNIPNWMVWTIDDNKATMGVFTADNVAVDPCEPELGFQDPAVGPTVDDLVTALRAVPGLTFSAPTDVTQDGYSGVRLDYVPPDELRNCLEDMGEAKLMSMTGVEPVDAHEYFPPPNGDDPVSVYIFDVDGNRVVITASYTSNRADSLDAMLASVRFESP